ncbi:MAG TPA: methyltransferase domain-containing protein [Burkholderiales bacterium]|nr:methyltransferase domain-containing protein [Burkholderiales bacterium]
MSRAFLRHVERRTFGLLCGVVLALAVLSAGAAPPLPAPGVRYEPTEPDVVEAMVRLARVNGRDVVYDLGCGDGRVVIAAVRAGAARGVCVDVDPRRIAESRENAGRAGVADRIRFLNKDLFATDLGDATVVMLFLSPEFNFRLKPKLQRELKPGARVVSHWHGMDDWAPQQTLRLRSEGRERNVFLWTIGPR